MLGGSEMINLIKKDLKLNFAIKGSVISLVLFLPFMLLVLGLDSKENIYPIMILSYSYILMSMPFKYDAREKPHLFIQSLPIKKRDVVISKYIILILNFIIAIGYTWLIFSLLNLLGFGMGNKLSISILKETLIIYILISSISLPAYLRLPPKIGNVVNIMIYVMIINIFALGSGVKDIMNLLVRYNIDGWMIFVVMAVVYFLSMGISISLYETRDLY